MPVRKARAKKRGTYPRNGVKDGVEGRLQSLEGVGKEFLLHSDRCCSRIATARERVLGKRNCSGGGGSDAGQLRDSHAPLTARDAQATASFPAGWR